MADQIPPTAMRESISAALVSGPVREADGTASFEWRFPRTDPVFAGHFPGQPLLPGIFQIEMTRLAAERTFGGTLQIREVIRAKFLRPIVPEETIRLSLKLSEEDSILQARATLVAGGQNAGAAALTLCPNVQKSGSNAPQ